MEQLIRAFLFYKGENMKRLIRKIIFLILGVIVLVGAVSWLFIDPIAKAGVEKGAGFALGVETSVDDLDLSLISGDLTMDGLTISNPEGFKSPHLMRYEHFELNLQPGSVFSDTIVLEKFQMDGLEVNIDQKLTKNNISVILDNLKKFESEDKEKSPSQKKLQLDHLLINNVVANVHVLSGREDSKPITIKIDKIELKDVTTGQDDGILISDLTAKIVVAVINAIVENGEVNIPDDLNKSLKAGLADTKKALESAADDLLKKASAELEKYKPKEGEDAENAEKSPAGGLFDILGGSKDEE